MFFDILPLQRKNALNIEEPVFVPILRFKCYEREYRNFIENVKISFKKFKKNTMGNNNFFFYKKNEAENFVKCFERFLKLKKYEKNQKAYV